MSRRMKRNTSIAFKLVDYYKYYLEFCACCFLVFSLSSSLFCQPASKTDSAYHHLSNLWITSWEWAQGDCENATLSLIIIRWDSETSIVAEIWWPATSSAPSGWEERSLLSRCPTWKHSAVHQRRKHYSSLYRTRTPRLPSRNINTS